MKIFSFKGGIHPQYNKEISISEPLREAPLPDIAIVPLSQHMGSLNEPVVNKGDQVEEGQLIGNSSSFVSSPVHAPIYGKVTDIKKAEHPSLGPILSVYIERDKTKASKKYTETDSSKMTKAECIEKIKEFGIVGMGGAAFPTYVKLSVPEGKKVTDLVINGAECEPYLTCDQVLMSRKSREVLKGIEILDKILKPERIFIAVEINKKGAIFAFDKLLRDYKNEFGNKTKTIALKTKYPQGGEKQIIKAISGKEVPPGKLPLDIGFLVQNAGTAYAIYEALYLNKPLYERIITISGDCMYRPGNFLVRTGTTINDVMNKFGIEMYKDPKKIIVGGPMMGFSEPGTEMPILKNTSGILFLSEDKVDIFEETACVKCAKCVDVCPMRLIPTEIMKHVKIKKIEAYEKLNITDCMECGACAYICPARIPIVQYVKEAKNEILKKNRK